MNSVYANYSREDLIGEIERLKATGSSVTDEKAYRNRILTNAIALRKTFSDVLSLLMKPGEKDIIDRSLLIVLKFFDVDRVYIGNYKNDESTFGFTHEVTRQGIISMREDLLVGMSKDDFPWWIKTIDDKKDIVINDIAQMPEEAAAEQKIVMLQDVKSLLVIPIFLKGISMVSLVLIQ